MPAIEYFARAGIYKKKIETNRHLRLTFELRKTVIDEAQTAFGRTLPMTTRVLQSMI